MILAMISIFCVIKTWTRVMSVSEKNVESLTYFQNCGWMLYCLRTSSTLAKKILSWVVRLASGSTYRRTNIWTGYWKLPKAWNRHTFESLKTSFTFAPIPSRPKGRTLPAVNLKKLVALQIHSVIAHWSSDLWRALTLRIMEEERDSSSQQSDEYHE